MYVSTQLLPTCLAEQVATPAGIAGGLCSIELSVLLAVVRYHLYCCTTWLCCVAHLLDVDTVGLVLYIYYQTYSTYTTGAMQYRAICTTGCSTIPLVLLHGMCVLATLM